MDFRNLINTVIIFFHVHAYIAIISMVVLGFLLYFKPKPMLKFVASVLALSVVFYLLSFVVEMTSTGISKKEKMVDKAPYSLLP